MKALKLLKEDRDFWLTINNDKSIIQKYDEAIKELKDLQNKNKSLVKTLEKYNKKMIELRKVNKDLKERSR